MTPLCLTIAQAAKRLSVTPQTVYGIINAGELEHVRIAKGAIRITESALAEYLERCRVPATPSLSTASAPTGPGCSPCTGRTPSPAGRDAFQQGRETARKQRDGGTAT